MATAAQLQATLTLYENARDEIVSGRVTTFQVEGQSYSTLSLPELEKQITKYRNDVAISNIDTSTNGHRNPLGVRGRLGGMGYQ